MGNIDGNMVFKGCYRLCNKPADAEHHNQGDCSLDSGYGASVVNSTVQYILLENTSAWFHKTRLVLV